MRGRRGSRRTVAKLYGQETPRNTTQPSERGGDAPNVEPRIPVDNAIANKVSLSTLWLDSDHKRTRLPPLWGQGTPCRLRGDSIYIRAALFAVAGSALAGSAVAQPTAPITSLTVEVTTANVRLAGTDNSVYLAIVHKTSQSSLSTSEWHLNTPGVDDFERGDTNTFVHESASRAICAITHVKMQGIGRLERRLAAGARAPLRERRSWPGRHEQCRELMAGGWRSRLGNEQAGRLPASVLQPASAAAEDVVRRRALARRVPFAACAGRRH